MGADGSALFIEGGVLNDQGEMVLQQPQHALLSGSTGDQPESTWDTQGGNAACAALANVIDDGASWSTIFDGLYSGSAPN